MWTQIRQNFEPAEERWVWALAPIVPLLSIYASEFASWSLSFGLIAQILFGVWMARRFGRQGLAAFAVGCVLASVDFRYLAAGGDLYSVGDAASDRALALFFVWLAADRTHSLAGSILERSGVVRHWMVFWPLLLLGLFEFDVHVRYGSAGLGPSLSFWTRGLHVLSALALLLGLAGVGRPLFTAFLLTFAVVLLGDFLHYVACHENLAPEWSCRALIELESADSLVLLDFPIQFYDALPALAGLVVAFIVGNHVRRLIRGDHERNALLHTPVKSGLVLLVIGIGLGPLLDLPVTGRFSLSFDGSPTMMMAGAFLLGSRLGVAGGAIAVCGYLGTILFRELIEVHPRLDLSDIHFSSGILLNCLLAAVIGTGLRDRHRVTLDRPRKFETATLFLAILMLLLGLLDLTSSTSIVWLLMVVLAAALAVLVIRFREERARAAGANIALLTDIVVTLAVLVFFQKHVPGIVEAFRGVVESAQALAQVDPPTRLEFLALGIQEIPIATLMFFGFLMLMVNVSLLSRRIVAMLRGLRDLVRMLQQRLRSSETKAPPST